MNGIVIDFRSEAARRASCVRAEPRVAVASTRVTSAILRHPGKRLHS